MTLEENCCVYPEGISGRHRTGDSVGSDIELPVLCSFNHVNYIRESAALYTYADRFNRNPGTRPAGPRNDARDARARYEARA